MGVATRCQERFLRDHDIVADIDVVLIVEPRSFANPNVASEMKLPRKTNPGAWAKHDAFVDLGAEQAESRHANRGTGLPGIGDKKQFDDGPQVNNPHRSIPRGALARRVAQGDYGDRGVPWGAGVGHVGRGHFQVEVFAMVRLRDMPPRKLRILVLGLHYAPELTGNAPYTSALARGLRQRGHEVRVITGYPHYPDWVIFSGYTGWARDSVEAGVRVSRRRQYVPRRPSSVKRFASEASYGLRLLFARWGEPDVVLAISPALFGTALAALKIKAKGLPAGVWVQDLYSLGVAETGQGGSAITAVVSKVESATLRAVAGVSVIHDRFRQHVVTRLNVTEAKVRVIRNWTHVRAPARIDRLAVRARLGWDEGETIALHSGNMGVKQGLDNLVEAARLVDELGVRLRFVLLGNGSQRDRLVAAAQGIRSIEFLDPMADGDFQQVLGSADVLVVNELAGVAEMSVPSKLTTYFSTGLPVVAAANAEGATASEIAVSGAGVRVDSGDPRALVDAILALKTDPERARRLGAAGLAFRDAVLGEDAAIDSYAEWLSLLVDSHGKR